MLWPNWSLLTPPSNAAKQMRCSYSIFPGSVKEPVTLQYTHSSITPLGYRFVLCVVGLGAEVIASVYFEHNSTLVFLTSTFTTITVSRTIYTSHKLRVAKGQEWGRKNTCLRKHKAIAACCYNLLPLYTRSLSLTRWLFPGCRFRAAVIAVRPTKALVFY